MIEIDKHWSFCTEKDVHVHIYFEEKCVGLHFGRFSHKLIWSPCLRTRFFGKEIPEKTVEQDREPLRRIDRGQFFSTFVRPWG
jgi:hypothetical protein